MNALAQIRTMPNLITTLPGGVRLITPLRVVGGVACCSECGRSRADARVSACRASGCPLVHGATSDRRETVTP